VVAWTDAIGYDNASTGYRISVADWEAAPSSVPTSCSTGSAYGKVGVSGTTSYTDSTLGSAPHTNFVDGRLWCYKAETVYPYPENTSPWISQVGNPTTVFEVGHTLVSATFAGDGDFLLEGGTSTTDGPDWFELTFNQAVDPSDYPSGYVCTDNTSDRILIGVDSSTSSVACPKTSGGADTKLSGFWLSGGTVDATARFAIGTVTSVGCPVNSPPGCFRLRIYLHQRTAGSNPLVGGTYVARGTANTSYLGTVGATRSFCQSGTATTVTGLSTTFKYRADPSGGNCKATVAGNF